MYWPRKFLGQGVRSQPTIAWKDGFKGLAGSGRVISIWKKAAWPHARQRPLLPTRSPKITSTLDTVGVQQPVHLLAFESDRQRVVRVVRALARSKTVREPHEVALTDGFEQPGDSTLDDLVLQ